MTDSIPPSNAPEFNTQELAAMRKRALDEAVARVTGAPPAAPMAPPAPPAPVPTPPAPEFPPTAMRMPVAPPQPEVVYVRRNPTLAEMLVALVVAVGIVAGFQAGWYLATDLIPRIEIRQR
jgi:hypothetical protein